MDHFSLQHVGVTKLRQASSGRIVVTSNTFGGSLLRQTTNIWLRVALHLFGCAKAARLAIRVYSQKAALPPHCPYRALAPLTKVLEI